MAVKKVVCWEQYVYTVEAPDGLPPNELREYMKRHHEELHRRKARLADVKDADHNATIDLHLVQDADGKLVEDFGYECGRQVDFTTTEGDTQT